MKKYILPLFVLVFVLGLFGLFNINVNSASAANCAPGEKFHTTLGYLCNVDATLVVQCGAGHLFNAVTGNACPAASSGVAGTIVTDRTMKVGLKGNDVKLVQQILAKEGYSLGIIDGSYGKRTARAIRDFQYDNDLPATGEVDANTLAKLNATLAGVASAGNVSTNQPSITVTYPNNANEKLIAGQTYNFTWNSTSINNVNLSVVKEGSNTTTKIADQVSDRGSYRWTIPANQEPGAYKFSVYAGDHGIVDLSNSAFTITAVGGTVNTAQPSITVISPNGGETLQAGTAQIFRWRVNDSSVRNVSLMLRDATTGRIYDFYTRTPNTGELRFTIPSNYTPGNYFLRVVNELVNANNTITIQLLDESDSSFIITAPQASSSNNATVSASLYHATDDKVGAWSNFRSGTGNINKNPYDWHWGATINLPTQKTVSRITVIHNTSGEVWSTGYSRYLGPASNPSDLYGYEEHPYPIVVTRDGNQINTAYDQNIFTGTGSYFFKLYGQPESTSFTGGKIVVEFSDGTYASSAIPASSIKQQEVVSSNTTTEPTVSVSRANVSSGGSSLISWTIPRDAVSAKLFLSCPSGVSGKNVDAISSNQVEECNRWTEVSISSIGKEIAFTNSTQSPINVVPNFYIYRSSNPSYAVGVSSQITVSGSNASTSIPKPSIHYVNPTTSPIKGEITIYGTDLNRTGLNSILLRRTPAISGGVNSFAFNASASSYGTWVKLQLPSYVTAGTYAMSVSTDGAKTYSNEINYVITELVPATAAIPASFFHNLYTTVSGTGSISANGASLCGYGTGSTSCTKSYAAGSQVTLSPSPYVGYTFSGWTGACSGTGSCSITLDSNKSVGATFVMQTSAATSPLAANAIGATANNSSVDGNTAAPAKFRFTQFLSEGSHGNEVRELQTALNARGYDVGNVDGNFGSKVKEAVIRFQTDNKLKTDGIVGYEVRTLLNK